MSESVEAVESSENEVESQIEETIDASEEAEVVTEEVKKELIKTLKLKVNGKEIEESLPFEIPAEHAEYFKKQLELAKAGHLNMQEASKIRKEAEQYQTDMRELLIALKEDPESVLSHPNLGIDLKEFAKKIIQREVENASKSPEQKEREVLEKKAKDLEERLKQIEEEKRNQERQRLESDVSQKITDGIISSVEKEGLPKDPRVIARFADALRVGAQYGVELTPDEIAPLIKKQMYEEAQYITSMLSDDDLEGMISRDRINKVHKQILSKMKKVAPSTKDIVDTGTSETKNVFDKKSKESVKSKDFFKNLSKKYNY